MSNPQPSRLRSITGRDEFIIAEALATALIALEQLPQVRQPTRNMSDFKMMLNSLCDPSEVSLHLTTPGGASFPARGLSGHGGPDPHAPLREKIFGYDAARMTFEFTMLASDAKAVECSISGAARDHLVGKKGANQKAREGQSQRFRVTIERLAFDLFDDGTGLVRIFAMTP